MYCTCVISWMWHHHIIDSEIIITSNISLHLAHHLKSFPENAWSVCPWTFSMNSCRFTGCYAQGEIPIHLWLEKIMRMFCMHLPIMIIMILHISNQPCAWKNGLFFIISNDGQMVSRQHFPVFLLVFFPCDFFWEVFGRPSNSDPNAPRSHQAVLDSWSCLYLRRKPASFNGTLFTCRFCPRDPRLPRWKM